MTTKRIAKMAAAVVVPFLVVWSANLLASVTFRGAEKATPVRVENFSDYIDAKAVAADGDLGAFVEVGRATPGPGARWFNDFAVTPSAVVLAGNKVIVALDKATGKVLRSDNLGDLAGFGTATAVTESKSGKLWVYGFGSGELLDYSVADGPRAGTGLDRGLQSVRWLDSGRLVATGLFDQNILRVYAAPSAGTQSLRPRASEAITWLSPSAALGSSLVPGLQESFSKQLNSAAVTVNPQGSRIAAALRWSDRIQIYDVRTLALERTIAGAMNTKLDFAIGRYHDQPVFTLAPESAFTYLDVASTDRLILALYSGREKRTGSNNFGLGSQIQVFTWDGRPAGVWRLPVGVQRIRLDASGTTLYGLRWQPEPSVVKWDLGPLLARGNQALAREQK